VVIGILALALGVMFVGVGAHTARYARWIARRRRELARRLPFGIQQMAIAFNSRWFLIAWGLCYIVAGAAVTFVGLLILVRR
jgi:hypothetical protein